MPRNAPEPPQVPMEVLIAYHEAGHAVAAMLCGVEVVSVEVVGEPRMMSEVPTVEGKMVIAAGGMAAEALLMDGWTAGGGMDCEMLEEMGVTGEALGELVSEVASLLRGNWTLVEAVARRLLLVGRMDGGQLGLLVLAMLVDGLLE